MRRLYAGTTHPAGTVLLAVICTSILVRILIEYYKQSVIGEFGGWDAAGQFGSAFGAFAAGVAIFSMVGLLGTLFVQVRAISLQGKANELLEKQLRASIDIASQSAGFATYQHMIDMMERVRPGRKKVEIMLRCGATPQEYAGLADEDKKTIEEVGRTFDVLGLLVHKGILPLRHALDFYSMPIVKAWSRMRGHVFDVRQSPDRPHLRHRYHFEMLAFAAHQYRLALQSRGLAHRSEETYDLGDQSEIERLSSWYREWEDDMESEHLNLPADPS